MNSGVSNIIQKKSKLTGILSLLMIFMLICMTLSSAVTIPNPLPSGYQYSYVNETKAKTVDYGSIFDRHSKLASRLNFNGPDGQIQAYSIDLAKSNINNNSNVYKIVPIDSFLDSKLNASDIKEIRGILYNVFVTYGDGTSLTKIDGTGGFVSAVNKNAVFPIEGSLNDNSIITGIQAAIWNFVADGVYIRDSHSLGDYRDHRNAGRIFEYLEDLAPMNAPASLAAGSASLSIGDIDGYTAGTANAAVRVYYTLTGTNYDSSRINWALAGLPGGAVRSQTDAELIADGTQHYLDISNIPDTTVLNLSITGQQVYPWDIYGLTTGNVNDQKFIVFGNQTKTITASASRDLNLSRGSMTLQKQVMNNTAQAGTFNVQVTGNLFSQTVQLAGNGAAVTLNGLRYGTYNYSESSPNPAYAAVYGSGSATIDKNNKNVTAPAVQNRKLGSITVTKVVKDNTDDAMSFTVTLHKDSADGEIVATGSVSEVTPYTFTGLEPGNYYVVESISNPAAYEAIVGGAAASVSDSGSDETVVLENLYKIPDLLIEKTAGVSQAKPGDEITYHVKVTNTGNIPLTNLSFSDSHADLSGNGYSELDVGAEYGFDYTYKVPDGYYGNLVNTVTVSTNELSPKSDTAAVFIKANPVLNVEKHADQTKVLPGETITYSADITNNGNVTISGITYNDGLMATGDVTVADLAPGESTTVSLGSAQAPVGQKSVTNIVDISGEYVVETTDEETGETIQETTPVSDESQITTDILQPSVELTKEVAPYARSNDEITYSFTVRNSGETPLKNVSIDDPLIGSFKVEDLAVGASSAPIYQTCSVKDLMSTSAWTPATSENLGTITNTATVTADAYRDDSGNTYQVSDSATAAVNILQPGISITKHIIDNESSYDSISAYAGDEINFEIVVTNTGDSVVLDGDGTYGYELYNITVDDELLGQSITIPYLAAGESFIWNNETEGEALKAYTVPADAPDTIVNTAVVTLGNEIEQNFTTTTIIPEEGTKLTSEASASINVMKPGISLTKTADSDRVMAGSTITYTFDVTNTGNVALNEISIGDEMLGGPIYVADTLDPGQTAKVTGSYITAPSFEGNLVNKATVTGWAPEEKEVSDDASASVQVYIPTPDAPDVPNVTLTVAIEGQGSVLPGSGSYSRSLGSVQVFNNITPEAGWEFDGWYGPNGNEISGNQLLLSDNKSVTARFVKIATVAEEPVPQGPPEVTPEPTPTPAPADNSTDQQNSVILDETVPQSSPELPKTAGIPLELLIGAGAALTGGGLGLRKSRKKNSK